MYRRNKEREIAPSETSSGGEVGISPAQLVADTLSYSGIPGRFWPTLTIRGTHVIRFGEEMEHRQPGYTLIIPNGPDVAVFEVHSASPFSGKQHYVKNVNSGMPTLLSSGEFSGRPNLSVVDIPVANFDYIKRITQPPEGLIVPTIEQDFLIMSGELDLKQQIEMSLVHNALRVIHPESALV